MVYIIKVKTNGTSNDSPVRFVDGILRLSDVESADIYDGENYVIRKKIPVYNEEQLIDEILSDKSDKP